MVVLNRGGCCFVVVGLFVVVVLFCFMISVASTFNVILIFIFILFFYYFFTFSFGCSSSSSSVRESAVGAPVDGRREDFADAAATVSGGVGGAFAPFGQRGSGPVQQWDFWICVCSGSDGNVTRRYQRRRDHYWCAREYWWYWCYYGHRGYYSYGSCSSCP